MSAVSVRRRLRRLFPLFSKADLVNRLAAMHGYNRFLEICTRTAGGRYAEIDRSILTSCHRLRYQCPAGVFDGSAVDFHSDTLDISECLAAIRQRALVFDIVLVDSWHEYDTSYRDLDEAMKLVASGGMVVVHDCLPPNAAVAAPRFVELGWCGVSYRAFLDFVLGHDDLDYCTVNTDYGCGVIRRSDPARGRTPLTRAVSRSWRRSRMFPFVTRTRPEGDVTLIEAWRAIGSDEAAFAFFRRHHPALLKLRSVGQLLREQEAQARSDAHGA